MRKALAACLGLFLSTVVSADPLQISTQDQLGPGLDIATKVMNEAYRRLGLTMTVSYMPLQRSLVEANSGRVDGELYRQAGIAAQYPYLRPVPVALVTGNIVAFAKRPLAVDGWKSLEAYTVAYLRGLKAVEDNLTAATKADSLTTLEQAFRLLDSDRVDLVVTSTFTGLTALKAMGIKGVTVVGQPLLSVPVFHYLNEKHGKLVLQLAEVLKQMEQEGTLSKIRDEVLGPLLH